MTSCPHRCAAVRWLLLAILLAGCVGGTSAPPPGGRPKLVVLFVVDGLPQRQVEAYRDQLAPDGLARFLERGAAFSQAHYGYAFTVTAAGPRHRAERRLSAPQRHHRQRVAGRRQRPAVYCTGDTAPATSATRRSRWTAPARAT
jgi:hypothetical protein